MSNTARERALGAMAGAFVTCLACSCGVHGNLHVAPPRGGAAGPRDGAALRAAFAVPEVAPAAVRAPIGLTTSDGSGLAIKSLKARARVHGPLVETEVRLTFKNPEYRVREGRFRIALPQHAFVSRLAMKIDGRLREAEIAEIGRAREVYDDIVHRRRDPLLVEQHGSNELSARVFPIDAQEEKEIVVGWIAEVSAESPVIIPLRGLPAIGHLEVAIEDSAGDLATLRADNEVPQQDVRTMGRSTATAVQSGDLLVTRVTVPGGEGAAQPIGRGLVVLVDTSASRAPDLEADVLRIREVLAALAMDEPDTNVTVAAFDQAVEVVYRGSLTNHGTDASARLIAHGALGASDLEGALRWAATEARATGATRALIVGDGLATGGSSGPTAMRAAARSLREAGVLRLDAIAEGDVRDESALRALAVGVLPAAGVVVDALPSSRTIASRLQRSVNAPVPVDVRGARWVWPSSLAGTQAGDERVIVAELPSATAPRVRVGGQDVEVRAIPGPRSLVDKTLARARVESLVTEGERAGFTDALRASIVTLAKTKRVPSPFTSFLVVETDADRQALLAPRVRPTAARPSAPAFAFALTPATAPAPAPAPTAAPAPPPDDLFAPVPPLPPPASTAAASTPPRGSHVPRPPQLRSAMCVVNGRLPPESIRRIVRQHVGQIRACYEEGLRRRGPSLAGRVSTKFVIARDGLVREAVNADSEIADDKVVACITATFAGMRFPEPEGGIATVTYPYVLRPPGAAPPDETEAEAEARKDPMPNRGARYNPWTSRQDWTPPAPPLPWSGDYAEVREAFSRSDLAHAFTVASAARAHDPQDVIALLALGEAYDRAGLPDLAMRAFGSIADLRPNDAPMLRVAAAHLARAGRSGAPPSPLVLELLRRASEDRPDHPHGRHAYAMALLRAGAHERAFDVLAKAIATSYADRFQNARLVLEDDLALVAAAWRAADPGRAAAIEARTAALTGPARIDGPSLSFVLSWETDMSDVDLFVRDASTAEDGSLPLVGSQRARASEGYGPESVVLTGARSARPKGRLTVRLGRKGPMGHVIGVVDVIEHDGLGHVAISARPFVAMNESAEIDLGPIDGSAD